MSAVLISAVIVASFSALSLFFSRSASSPGLVNQSMLGSSQQAFRMPSLFNLTVDTAAKGLQAGHFTSEELVRAYLARIEESAEFKAVLEVNPDVIEDARRLDAARNEKSKQGALYGLPILVKDNIVTKDRLQASAGSWALLDAKPAQESSVIAKLRAAGILILGKANPSEWANIRGNGNPTGWSPRGGQTMGVYYPGSRPEGSSAGPAVATTLGLCLAALGTETSGSIVDPGELNNIVGFKPSRGLVANDGVIPITRRQDVIGTMTHSVKDAAYFLSHMAGSSQSDDGTWDIPFESVPDFASFCNDEGLVGVRVGVPRNAFSLDDSSPVRPAFDAALDTIKSLGAEVKDNTDFAAAEEFGKLWDPTSDIVRASEFKRDIAQYLASLEHNPNNLHSIEDIIEFTKQDPRENYPERDIERFLWTQVEGVGIDGEKYKQILQKELRLAGEGGITGALAKYDIDVLAIPTTGGVADDMAAKLGAPIITVPLGFYPEGTPIQRGPGDLIHKAPGMAFCIMFVTKPYSDDVLLRVAHAFERATRVRENGRRPYKLPTTELNGKGSL